MLRNLTINLGLRYELDLPPYDTEGRIGGFDPAFYRPRMEVEDGFPVGPPVGGIVMAGNALPQYDLPGVPRVGKRILKSVDPNNFGPRLGLAWSPLNSDRLVLRGGYGIFYSRPSFIYLGLDFFAPRFISRLCPLDKPLPTLSRMPFPRTNFPFCSLAFRSLPPSWTATTGPLTFSSSTPASNMNWLGTQLFKLLMWAPGESGCFDNWPSTRRALPARTIPSSTRLRAKPSRSTPMTMHPCAHRSRARRPVLQSQSDQRTIHL